MSLEAIEKITQVERVNQERKAAAEAEAKQIVADAERGGLALLQQVRAEAAETGKKLIRQAGRRKRRLPPCGKPRRSIWRKLRSLLSEGL